MASRNFFEELKRRNVYKVAVAYAIVGWLGIQIAKQTSPFLEILNWVIPVSHWTRYYPLHGDPRFEAVVQKVVRPVTSSKL